MVAGNDREKSQNPDFNYWSRTHSCRVDFAVNAKPGTRGSDFGSKCMSPAILAALASGTETTAERTPEEEGETDDRLNN